MARGVCSLEKDRQFLEAECEELFTALDQAARARVCMFPHVNQA